MDDDDCFTTININLKGRKMKFHTKKFSTIIMLCLLAVVMTSSVCSAQGSRSGRSEIYGILQTLSGWTETDPDGDKYGLDDAFVYGVGIGYNIDDHLNLNSDFAFGTQDFYGGGGSVTAFLWNVNLDYNILAEPLTPLVSGGVGLSTLSGDGVSESDFSYNLGVGGRWDITDNIFVKATYRMTWITDLDVDEDGIFVGIGYMF
jgi:opacity protein-like surface antigen